MIPTNLTLDELLKFYELPQPILDCIERGRQVWQGEQSELERQMHHLDILDGFTDSASEILYDDIEDTEKVSKIKELYEQLERDL